MPYPITTNDTIRVQVYSLVAQQICINTMDYDPTTLVGNPEGPTFLTQTIDAIFSPGAWGMDLRGCMGSNTVISYATAQVIAPTRRALVRRSLNLTGMHNNECHTANISCVVTKRTELATARKQKLGIGGVGSFHIAGIPLDTFTDSVFTAVYLAGPVTDFMNKLDNFIVVGGTVLQPVLFGRNSVNQVRTPITSVAAEPTVRVMRRRTVGLGI